MSKTLRNGLIVVVILSIGSLLVLTSILIVRYTSAYAGFWNNSMIGFQPYSRNASNAIQTPYGMMGGGIMNRYNGQDYPPYGLGTMGSWMMGGNASGGQNSKKPLSIEQARNAVEEYLNGFGNPNLKIKEVMIFDNHAYAEIVEKNTGIGAMEALVDPATLVVYPEPGPNMMWNLKYGMMSGHGGYGMMGGGMMGGWRQNYGQTGIVSADMPVSSKQATEIAQQYLDKYLPGTQAENHADVFYGYYTLHVLRTGKVIGMLSVNGYSGQVFPHTWHGNFVEMSEEE